MYLWFVCSLICEFQCNEIPVQQRIIDCALFGMSQISCCLGAARMNPQLSDKGMKEKCNDSMCLCVAAKRHCPHGPRVQALMPVGVPNYCAPEEEFKVGGLEERRGIDLEFWVGRGGAGGGWVVENT